VQPAYAVIHHECVQEFEEELVVADELLLSAPHVLYPNIPCDSAIYDFRCENISLDVSTSDHSQDTSDVSISLHCGEDTYLSENPFNISSVISKNIEG